MTLLNWARTSRSAAAMGAAFSVLLAVPQSVRASSDACYPDLSLRVEREELSNCSSDLPYLNRWNDSQSNTFLLLSALAGYETWDAPSPAAADSTPEPAAEAPAQTIGDALKSIGIEPASLEAAQPAESPAGTSSPKPTPPKVYYDDLDPRQSNNEDTTVTFLEQLKALSSVDNRRDLAKRRIDLFSHLEGWQCGEIKNVIADNAEPSAKDLGAYLMATEKLYCQNYTEAAKLYCSLQAATTPWVKETALYLCGRAHLIASQSQWDGYSDPKTQVTKTEVLEAKTALEKYIKEYPDGLYLESARGLFRRANYLDGTGTVYIAALVRAFEDALKERDHEGIAQLTAEFDYRGIRTFSTDSVIPDDPVLFAVRLFQEARADDFKGEEYLAYLDTHREKFAPYPGLEAVLRAELQLLNKDFKGVTAAQIPSASHVILRRSLLAVQAEAYDKLGDLEGAIRMRREILATYERTSPPEGAAEKRVPTDDPLSSAEEPSEDPPIGSTMTDAVAKGASKDWADREGIAILRSLLRARAFESLGNPPAEIPPWAVQLGIQQVVGEEGLKKLCTSDKPGAVWRRIACETLIFVWARQERFADLLALKPQLPNDVRDKQKGRFALFERLSSGKPDGATLVEFGDYLVNEPLETTNYSPFFTTRFLSEFAGEEGYRASDDFSPVKSAAALYLTAARALEKQGAKEPEAEAITRFLNCFRASGDTYRCHEQKDERTGTIDEVYPKELREKLFKRLKGAVLGKTPAAREQKYWY